MFHGLVHRQRLGIRRYESVGWEYEGGGWDGWAANEVCPFYETFVAEGPTTFPLTPLNQSTLE